MKCIYVDIQYFDSKHLIVFFKRILIEVIVLIVVIVQI